MLFIKSLFVLCSAAVVFARTYGESVASRAIFVGKDTTDRSSSARDIFAKPANHASAVSSLLVAMASAANFRPSEQKPKGLGSKYEFFVEKVSGFAFFMRERDEEIRIQLEGTRRQFEDAVFDTNPSSPHQSQVARILRSLVPRRAENEEYWILSLIVIDKPKDGDIVKFSLVSVTLLIETDKTGKATIPQQEAILRTSVFEPAPGVFVVHADKFAERFSIVHVPEAEKFFDSEKEDEDMTSCHQKPAVFVDQGQRALENWYNGNY